ncbi:MAG TPA: hypothetical protein VGF67_29070 [Ktedonobacteraceae bacterium]|jgi:hypothetical protein
MVPLINREKELNLIRDAITALTSDDRLVETPIVNIFGLPGIGKSRLLDEIVSMYNPVQWHNLEASEDVSVCAATPTLQIVRYLPGAKPPPPQTLLVSLKALLSTASLILLVDNIESTDEQQLYFLEILLQELIAYNNIFILLVSQSELAFPAPEQRKIRRKLTPQSLTLLDKAASTHYFLAGLPSLTEEQQERLFTWTQGHPLAMEEIIYAFSERNGRYDLADEHIHPQLLQGLLDVLITRRVHLRAPERQKWFEDMLRLLAVPRRFNVIVIRLLVERFAPADYRLASSVEYVKLPREIGQVTGVLQWKRELAGFTLEEPVRTLLLFQLRMQSAAEYRALNGFLADHNWQYASETEHMEDRVQYEKEFVYHRLAQAESDERGAAVTEALQRIFTLAAGEPTQLLYFQKELFADRGLRDALGADFAAVRQQLYRGIADVLYQAYRGAGPDARGQAFDVLFKYLREKIPESDRGWRGDLLTDYLEKIGAERNSGWLMERYTGLEETDSNGL